LGDTSALFAIPMCSSVNTIIFSFFLNYGGHATLEKIAKPKVSYSEDYDEAVRSCEFWRSSLIENVFDMDKSDPIELQEKAKQEVSDGKSKKININRYLNRGSHKTN
jgi:hypothetical protein